jgi:RsiW-degrading membrane proteinase PrsW (M82 family)
MQTFYFYLLIAPIAVAWLFIRWLLDNDRGPKEPRRILILAGVLGVAGFIAGLILESGLVNPKLVTHPHSLDAKSLLIGCLLVGLIEEGVKALPLATFIYRKGYFNEVTDGIIYFGISGMVFGVLEDIGYTLSLGIGAGIAKILTGPFSHAGFTSIFGWSLARHKMLHTPKWTVVLGFTGSVLIHALYDFGLFYGRWWSLICSLMITAVVNVGVFKLFRRAQITDVGLGLSSVQSTNFCTNCGQPNPKHLLFCVACGHKA